MKSVSEAITLTQGKKAGIVNRASVRYAESLLSPGEDVIAAVVANIKTKRNNFPGVVLITTQNVMAVCGLPGIKRCISLPVEDLAHCEETSSPIQYKAVFHTQKDMFAMTIDPELGEKFTAYIAQLNGEKLETIKLTADGNVFNPNYIIQRKRNQMRKEKNKAKKQSKEIELQKKAAANFNSKNTDPQ